jgi:hypothetical protein
VPDRLTERFARFAEDVRTPPLPPATTVRARGDVRGRRQAAIVVLAAVVAVILGGTLVGAALVRGDDAVPPASVPAPTAFPTAFKMPHEGEAGWSRSDDPAAPGAFNPCGTVDLTRTDRIAAITVTGRGYVPMLLGAEIRYTEQVLLFSGVTSTRNTLLELTAAANGCGWHAGLTEGTALSTVLNAFNDGERPLSAVVVLRDKALIILYAEGPAGYDTSAGVDLFQISDSMCQTMSMCNSQTACDLVPPPTSSVKVSCPVFPFPNADPTLSYPQPNPASVRPSGITPTATATVIVN